MTEDSELNFEDILHESDQTVDENSNFTAFRLTKKDRRLSKHLPTQLGSRASALLSMSAPLHHTMRLDDDDNDDDERNADRGSVDDADTDTSSINNKPTGFSIPVPSKSTVSIIPDEITKKPSGGFSLSKPMKSTVSMIGSEGSTGGFSLSVKGVDKSNFITSNENDDAQYELNDVEGIRKDRVEDGLVFFSKNFQILLKGGTKEKIIERIIVEKSPDMQQDLVSTFLLTYRSLFSPVELLEQFTSTFLVLYESYEVETPGESRMLLIKMTKILCSWVSDHFHDFSDDDQFYDLFIEKINESIGSIDDKLAIKIVSTLEKSKEKFENRENLTIQFEEPPPTPIIPKKMQLEDFDPLEFARQLCLFEQNLFRNIHPLELMDQNWNKNKEASPNLTKMISFFNNLSRALASKICNTDSLKTRGKIIFKIFHTTVYLREFNNFNAAMAMVACLNSSGVYRMKISWYHAQRKEKVWEAFEEVEATLSSDSAYRKIREAVKSANPPCIPYIGVYLTDLTFIEDGNPKHLTVEHKRDDIINFEKMRKVATIIEGIQVFQQKPYNFVIIEGMQNYFEEIAQGIGCDQTEDEDYRKSRELESREKIELFSDKKKLDLQKGGSLRKTKKRR